MLVSDFDQLWQARPFRPFTVNTADGRSILVPSPEFAWHTPTGRIVWIAERNGNGRVRMIDLHLVTSLDFVEGGELPRTELDEFPEVPPGPDEQL